MQNTIILLIEQIVVALGGEFKLYLPQLIPHMLRVFMHDNSTGRSVTVKVRKAGSGVHFTGIIPSLKGLLIALKQSFPTLFL